MIMRLFLVVALSFFVVGCAPAKKESVVTPKKNPDSAKVESQKGNDTDRGGRAQRGPAKGDRK